MRLILSAVLLLAGLGAAKAQPIGLKGDWIVAGIAGVDARDLDNKGEFKFLDDDRIAATLGCNRMIGGVRISGEEIKLGPVAMTQMACPPPLDRYEHVFTTALEKARRIAVAGDSLTLLDDAAKPLVTLRRKP